MTTPAKTAKPVAITDDRQPYTLESSALLAEIERQRQSAISEIQAIDAAINDIEQRAARDIIAIEGRRDTEIEARRARSADLSKLIAIADRAVSS